MTFYDPIHWIPLDSDALKAAAYQREKQRLYLQFTSGEVYRYLDFPPEQFADFMSAESHGQYFANHIRERFQTEHLPQSRGASGF